MDLSDAVGSVHLVLDMCIVHERWGSRSNPLLNSHHILVYIEVNNCIVCAHNFPCLSSHMKWYDFTNFTSYIQKRIFSRCSASVLSFLHGFFSILVSRSFQSTSGNLKSWNIHKMFWKVLCSFVKNMMHNAPKKKMLQLKSLSYRSKPDMLSLTLALSLLDSDPVTFCKAVACCTGNPQKFSGTPDAIMIVFGFRLISPMYSPPLSFWNWWSGIIVCEQCCLGAQNCCWL